MVAIKVFSCLVVAMTVVDVVTGQEPCPGLTGLVRTRCNFPKGSNELMDCHRCLWAKVPQNARPFWTVEGCRLMKEHVNATDVNCDPERCTEFEKTAGDFCLAKQDKGSCFRCIGRNCNMDDSCANKLRCIRDNINTGEC